MKLFPYFKIYVGGLIYFGLNCALASIGAFLPTVITTFGNSESVYLTRALFANTFLCLQVPQEPS